MSSDGPWTQEQVGRAGLRQRSVQFLCQDICGLTHTEHMQAPGATEGGQLPCTPRAPGDSTWPFLLQQKSKVPGGSDVTNARLMSPGQGSRGYWGDKHHVSHPAPTQMHVGVQSWSMHRSELILCARWPPKGNQQSVLVQEVGNNKGTALQVPQDTFLKDTLKCLCTHFSARTH